MAPAVARVAQMHLRAAAVAVEVRPVRRAAVPEAVRLGPVGLRARAVPDVVRWQPATRPVSPTVPQARGRPLRGASPPTAAASRMWEPRTWPEAADRNVHAAAVVAGGLRIRVDAAAEKTAAAAVVARSAVRRT